MLLVQALLPAFIYASAPRGSYLSEVCTAFGIRKVPVSGDDASGALPSPVRHCPVCAVAHLLALPPGIAVPDFSVAAVFEPPLAADSQEFTAPRLSPYLRGPPFLFT